MAMQGRPFEGAKQINTFRGQCSNHNGILRLQKDQLEEANAWAAQMIRKKQINRKRIYLIAMIISFLLAPFAFSGLLEPSPYMAWIGQFGLGIFLILSGIYFSWQYWKY